MKSDTQLRRDVEDELAAEPSVDATAIGGAAEDGLVTLPGHVASYSDRVTNEDIARAAINALAWNALVPRETGSRLRWEAAGLPWKAMWIGTIRRPQPAMLSAPERRNKRK